MKKNIIMLSIILGLIILFFSVSYTINLNGKNIKIDGTTYAITIDGVESNNLPLSVFYYLDSYECVNNSIITWDYENHDLYIEGTNTTNDKCTLNFATKQYLNKMKVGDYVAYVGDPENGCLLNDVSTNGTGEAKSGNSCKGENANQPAGSVDALGSYGYCAESSQHYTTYGWRIAYIEEGKVNLISAGSPECRRRTSSENNADTIDDLNDLALKYCNAEYVDGGVCPETPSETNNVRALGNEDFKKITYEISGTESNLTAAYGNTHCQGVRGYKRCGHYNNLIDNDGIYWFAAHNNSTNGLMWNPGVSYVYSANLTSYAAGFRPVITLSSEVYVTGGKGTMEEPYIIGIDTN